MKSKLKSKFPRPHYLQDNFLKVRHLKQGCKSIEEYTIEFEQLLLKCDLKEDKSQTLIKYLSGLNEEIGHVVEVHPYTSLDELSVLAHKVELQKRAKVKGMGSKPKPDPYPLQKPSYNPPKSTPNTNLRTSPPSPPQTPSKQPQNPVDKKRCFRGQGLGHFASECPNKRVATLVEYQGSYEELEEENNEREKELLMAEALKEVEEGPN